MKKAFISTLLIVSMFCSVFTASLVHAAPGVSFDFTLDKTQVDAGQLVKATIVAKNVPDYYAYELELSYDSAKLDFVISGSDNESLDVKAQKAKGGNLLIAMVKSGTASGAGDSVPLATVTFRGKTSGGAAITLTAVKALEPVKLDESSFEVGAVRSVTIQSSDSGQPGGGTGTGNGDGNGDNDGGGNGGGAGGNSDIIRLTPLLTGSTAQAAVIDTQLLGALTQASTNNEGIKQIQVVLEPIAGAKQYNLQLPVSVFQAASSNKESTASITITTPIADLTVPDHMFKTNDLSQAQTISFSIAEADKSLQSEALKKKMGDKPLIKLTVQVDGETVAWKNNKAPVQISMDYTPTAEELRKPDHIVIWYIDQAGKVHKVPSGKYNAVTGKVTFSITHFSLFAVVYDPKTFKDIEKFAWAKEPIEVLASKGIVNGTSETTFTPAASVKRGDFIKLLVTALDLHADVEASFDDVPSTHYAYEAIGIAKVLGIAAGEGYNRLNPNAPITRQDMAVMTARGMSLAGKPLKTATEDSLSEFKDAEKVAAYAKSSMESLIQSGIIQGDQQMLHPTGVSTRAEAAVILYRIYTL
jgi:hypothetical protein